ncbi:hypothetical protein CPB85DRAFT_155135 [Mucidula mucida]|nr:hypothetical protein CPB85DRAFT_155135 [Mucidula mucida]
MTVPCIANKPPASPISTLPHPTRFSDGHRCKYRSGYYGKSHCERGFAYSLPKTGPSVYKRCS